MVHQGPAIRSGGAAQHLDVEQAKRVEQLVRLLG
jgi:hypothetical protein